MLARDMDSQRAFMHIIATTCRNFLYFTVEKTSQRRLNPLQLPMKLHLEQPTATARRWPKET